MLHMEYDITGLRGADYNPRKIADADIRVLMDSVRDLGMVKPLIVRNDLLVAGHQRTKALRALGITKAPAYVLPEDTTTYDEVRFNQLHNGTDMDSGDEECYLGVPLELGYNIVETDEIEANWKCKLAVVRDEIVSLIGKYGPWGGVVAVQETGEVIHCAQYAIAASLTATPLTVYAIPLARRQEYIDLLSRKYGEFNYDNIERRTFIQTYAQPVRMLNGERGVMDSVLYRSLVLPWLDANNGKVLRLLDFGSGYADSPQWMRKQGYNMLDVELFRRIGGSDQFDVTGINRMIDALCKHIRNQGLFDVVICDSVLNSIDTDEAEEAVLAFITGMCRPGGSVFFSGRSREHIEAASEKTFILENNKRRHIEFMDNNGVTGLFRKGQWFFQKFHTLDQVEDLAQKHKLQKVRHLRPGNSWQFHGIAPETDWDRLIKAAEFEFNLPLPSGVIGRAGDVKSAILSLKK